MSLGDQGYVLVAVVIFFGWPQLGVLYTKDDFGYDCQEAFLHPDKFKNLTVFSSALDEETTKTDHVPLQMMKGRFVHVFALCVKHPRGQATLQAAHKLNMIGPGWLWIMKASVSTITQKSTPEIKKLFQGSIELIEYINISHPYYIRVNEAMRRERNMTDIDQIADSAWPQVDMVYFFVKLYRKLIQQDSSLWNNSTAIQGAILGGEDEGIGGLCQLDENGDRISQTFQVNVYDDKGKGHIHGLVANGTVTIFSPIVWPDGTTNTPSFPLPLPPEKPNLIFYIMIPAVSLAAVIVIVGLVWFKKKADLKTMMSKTMKGLLGDSVLAIADICLELADFLTDVLTYIGVLETFPTLVPVYTCVLILAVVATCFGMSVRYKLLKTIKSDAISVVNAAKDPTTSEELLGIKPLSSITGGDVLTTKRKQAERHAQLTKATIATGMLQDAPMLGINMYAMSGDQKIPFMMIASTVLTALMLGSKIKGFQGALHSKTGLKKEAQRLDMMADGFTKDVERERRKSIAYERQAKKHGIELVHTDEVTIEPDLELANGEEVVGERDEPKKNSAESSESESEGSLSNFSDSNYPEPNDDRGDTDPTSLNADDSGSDVDCGVGILTEVEGILNQEPSILKQNPTASAHTVGSIGLQSMTSNSRPPPASRMRNISETRHCISRDSRDSKDKKQNSRDKERALADRAMAERSERSARSRWSTGRTSIDSDYGSGIHTIHTIPNPQLSPSSASSLSSFVHSEPKYPLPLPRTMREPIVKY